MFAAWRTVLLLGCYDCDSTHQHYDVTRFEYALWRRTMHEWVMNIHYQTWIAQGRFISIIRTHPKQWGVCDKYLGYTRWLLDVITVTMICNVFAMSRPGAYRSMPDDVQCIPRNIYCFVVVGIVEMVRFLIDSYYYDYHQIAIWIVPQINDGKIVESYQHLPIFAVIESLALKWSYDCPNASKGIMDMDKTDSYQIFLCDGLRAI